MAVSFAREEKDKDKDKNKVERFKSLTEWNLVKSTKMDITAQIVKHTLSSDRAPPVEFVDGQAIFPDVPPLSPGEIPTKKIVIYQHFACWASVLRNVSGAYLCCFYFVY